MSVFGVFVVCIFPHSEWILRDTSYLSVFSPNLGKYGPEKSRILILFAKWDTYIFLNDGLVGPNILTREWHLNSVIFNCFWVLVHESTALAIIEYFPLYLFYKKALRGDFVSRLKISYSADLGKNETII